MPRPPIQRSSGGAPGGVGIGVVDQGSDAVEVQGQFSVPLTELRATWEATLPKLFG